MAVQVKVAAFFLIGMFQEVKLQDDFILEEKKIFFNKTETQQNILFEFDNIDFDGHLSDEWKDALLDIQKEAEASKISEEVVSNPGNEKPEVSGGSGIIRNTAIAGTSFFRGQGVDISITCQISRGEILRTSNYQQCICCLVCKQLGRIIAIRQCPRN